MSAKRPRTNGIERAFQILDCLVETGRPATAYTIAKKKKAPLSTVYSLIENLENLGVLVRHNDEGEFFIGSKMFSLGLAFANSTREDEVLRQATRDLAFDTGYDVLLCIRDGGEMLVTFKGDGRDSFRVSAKVGTRLPLTWTATGLVLLGYLGEEERMEVWRNAEVCPDWSFLCEPEALESKCRVFREQGFGVQSVEVGYDEAYIAAPIVGQHEECRAVLCLVVPGSAARDRSRGGPLAEKAVTAADAIAVEMGWARKRIRSPEAFLNYEMY